MDSRETLGSRMWLIKPDDTNISSKGELIQDHVVKVGLHVILQCDDRGVPS